LDSGQDHVICGIGRCDAEEWDRRDLLAWSKNFKQYLTVIVKDLKRLS